jgi:hypothetical protein
MSWSKVMSGIGTEKVFENDRVVVWHLDLEPGEQCEQHTHKLDYVARVISGSTLEVSGPDGELLYAVERKAGDVLNFQTDDDHVVADCPGSSAVPARHSVRNIGASSFKEVLIEFKY